MSSSTFTVLSCDRCGHQHTIDPDKPATAPAGWGKINAIAINRAARIGDSDGGDDLCPACLDALFAWFAEPRAPVDQPPPPPPPPPRPRFTIEMRAAIVGRADEMLRGQVEAAFAAVREEPTSLLNGATVAGALAGIPERAMELGDFVAKLVQKGGR